MPTLTGLSPGRGRACPARPRLQQVFQFLAQIVRKPRVIAAGRNGEVEALTRDPRGKDEIALAGRIGDVGEYAAPLGGNADAMVGEAVVGGGKYEHIPGQVGGAERAAYQAHREGLEFTLAIGRHHGDARTRLEQALSLAQRYFARANHQHGAVLERDEDRIVFQSKL